MHALFESDAADAPVTDSRGNGSAESDGESSDTGVTAESETALLSDIRGYATVLASDSRSAEVTLMTIMQQRSGSSGQVGMTSGLEHVSG